MKNAEPDAVDRIERRLSAEEFPNAQSAIEEASRLAVLETVPEIAETYEKARRSALGSAAPDGGADVPVRLRLGITIAIVLAVVGPVLISSPKGARRHLLDLQHGGLWAGLAEVAAWAMFWRLARYRQQPLMSVMNFRPRSYLIVGTVWGVLLASVLLFRLREIHGSPEAPVAGLGLSAAAIAGMVALYFRTRAADKEVVLNSEGARLGPKGLKEVRARLDWWWSSAQTELTDTQREEIVRAWHAGLDVLTSRGVITAGERASAGVVPPWLLWREDRR